MTDREAAGSLGVHSNSFRYAAPTPIIAGDAAIPPGAFQDFVRFELFAKEAIGLGDEAAAQGEAAAAEAGDEES